MLQVGRSQEYQEQNTNVSGEQSRVRPVRKAVSLTVNYEPIL
jgi:hypothetical protein